MSNEPKNLEGGVIAFDYEAFKKECDEKAEKLSAQAPDWHNPNLLKPLITDTNRWVKGEKAKVDDLQNQILEKFGFPEFKEKYLACLSKVEQASKRLSADRLTAEKTAKKEKARQFFLASHYGDPDINGEVLDFDGQVWEDDWAKSTVTLQDMLAFINAKVASLRSKDYRLDALIDISNIRKQDLEELEVYIISKRFVYSIEKKPHGDA